MKGIVIGICLATVGVLAMSAAFRRRAPQPAHEATTTGQIREERVHTEGVKGDRASDRVLIPVDSLPEGYSDEPVYTVNGLEYIDEETKWAWAYSTASLEELMEARDALRYVYFDLALPELAEARKDPERTTEIGEANEDGSWSFQPGGVLPSTVWKRDGKVYVSVLTKEQHPSICEVRREFLWLDDRIWKMEIAAYKQHLADKGPGYDHSNCTPAEKLGVGSDD